MVLLFDLSGSFSAARDQCADDIIQWTGSRRKYSKDDRKNCHWMCGSTFDCERVKLGN